MPFLQQNDSLSTRHELIGRSAIGRHHDNDIVLSGHNVSRHHAEIREHQGAWHLRDLDSMNGSYRNGERVSDCILRDGDRIRIGDATFVFKAEPDPMSTVPDGRPAEAPGIPVSALSEREKEIVALLAQGSTDQQIARALQISPATVRSHLDRIRDKTGCRRRVELARLAMELRLTE